MWAMLYSSAFELPRNLTTEEEIEEYLSDLESIEITIDVEKKLITRVVR